MLNRRLGSVNPTNYSRAAITARLEHRNIPNPSLLHLSYRFCFGSEDATVQTVRHRNIRACNENRLLVARDLLSVLRGDFLPTNDTVIGRKSESDTRTVTLVADPKNLAHGSLWNLSTLHDAGETTSLDATPSFLNPPLVRVVDVELAREVLTTQPSLVNLLNFRRSIDVVARDVRVHSKLAARKANESEHALVELVKLLPRGRVIAEAILDVLLAGRLIDHSVRDVRPHVTHDSHVVLRDRSHDHANVKRLAILGGDRHVVFLPYASKLAYPRAIFKK